MSERITESLVRDILKSKGYYSNKNITVEEQSSKFKNINDLLKTSSKSGKNKKGFPEFIISSSDYPNHIIIIECKKDTKNHESANLDIPKDYAVDGAIWYSKKLAKRFKVISVGVSGQKKSNLKLSVFFQDSFKSNPLRLNTKYEKPINEILSFGDFVPTTDFDPVVSKKRLDDIFIFSRLIHNYLREHAKVSESQKPLIICGTLIALKDDNFKKKYRNLKPKDLAQQWFNAIKREIFSSKMPNLKKENILNSFIPLKDHPKLNKKSKKFSSGVLHELIIAIDENVFPYINVYKDFDVIGKFFSEFLKYSGGDKQSFGIVLTPHHITNLFTQLSELTEKDVVVDTCCGTGGFLVAAMQSQISKVSTAKEKEFIMKNNIVGAEDFPEMFTLAAGNMILRGDGKANIYQGDCFDEKVIESLKSHKPTLGFINPPFAQKDEDLHELEYVKNMLSLLPKRGKGIAILPMSCVITPSQLKIDLLKENTLEGVLSMPNDLFYPVGTVTCILIFSAKISHPENKETWFGYCKDDGFRKDKILGRIDYYNKWTDINKTWVDSFLNRKVVKNFSLMKAVTGEDEWCAEAYMETDYSLLTEKEYNNTVKDFLKHLVDLE